MKKLNLLLIILSISHLVNAQTNNCLDFDGADDYIYIGDVVDLGTSDFTIESWVYIESTSGNANKIISKGITTVGTPSNAGYALRASKTGADEIEFHIGNSDGSTKRVIYNGVTTGVWYHVAGVRSGKKLYLYLDGVLVKEDSTSTVYNVDTNIPLVIGALHKGGMSAISEFMNGKIDEVRIWNTARSEFEINTHKNCAITSPEPNLIGLYNLNETSGTIAYDSSGNSNNGDLENGPLWIASTVAPICASTVRESKKNLINVHPNPFLFEIYIDNVLPNSAFKIYDIAGNVALDGSLNQKKIDGSKLSKGSYILEFTNGSEVRRTKIIKQ